MRNPVARFKRRFLSSWRKGSHMNGRSVHAKFRSVGTGVECPGSVEVRCPERSTVGNYVYIGPRTHVYGMGGVEIHDHVIFGPEVAIMTDMHNFKDAEILPYDSVELLMPVIIERCVWVGLRAIIMPGVRIGEGSIVGAGAVVTKSCEPGSIVAGNPARVIGKRDMEHYRKLVEEEQFYFMLKQRHNLEKVLVPLPEAESESRR